MKAVSSFENRYTSWIIDNSTVVLLVCLLISSALAAGVKKLKNKL